MTHKSQFKAEGYTWLWQEDDDALLREKEGNIERWRRIDNDTPLADDATVKRASFHRYVWVADETFMPLPLTGRFDLEAGQIVEIVDGRHKGEFGVIESLYTISGGVRYRITFDGEVRKSFKPRQVKIFQ